MLIHDVKPRTVVTHKSIKRGYDAHDVSKVETDIIVNELFERRVSIKDIFGKYYEREVAADGRSMTLEDAELAGVADTVVIITERQPF